MGANDLIVIAHPVGAGGTNFNMTYAQLAAQLGTNTLPAATNNDLLVGLGATNDDLLFGLGATNEALAIGAGATNEALLIGLNGTNNLLGYKLYASNVLSGGQLSTGAVSTVAGLNGWHLGQSNAVSVWTQDGGALTNLQAAALVGYQDIWTNDASGNIGFTFFPTGGFMFLGSVTGARSTNTGVKIQGQGTFGQGDLLTVNGMYSGTNNTGTAIVGSISPVVPASTNALISENQTVGVSGRNTTTNNQWFGWLGGTVGADGVQGQNTSTILNNGGAARGVSGFAFSRAPNQSGVVGDATVRLSTSTNFGVAATVQGASLIGSSAVAIADYAEIISGAYNGLGGTDASNLVSTVGLEDNRDSGLPVHVWRTNSTEVGRLDASGNLVIERGAYYGNGAGLTNLAGTTTNIFVQTNNVDYITVNSNTFVTFLTDVLFSGKAYLNLTVATNLPGTGYGFKTLTTPTSSATNWVLDGSQATVFKVKLTNDFNLLYVTNASTLGASGVLCSLRLLPNGADRNITLNSNICLLDTNGWSLLTTMNPGLWWRSLTNAANANGARNGWLSVSCDDTSYVQTNVVALFKESP